MKRFLDFLEDIIQLLIIAIMVIILTPFGWIGMLILFEAFK